METYRVTFMKRNGRSVTFIRDAHGEDEAINVASMSFQWAYGYYPDSPVEVVKVNASDA